MRLSAVVGGMLACVLLSSTGLAQITTGTVSGSVKDPTGAVIPGDRGAHE